MEQTLPTRTSAVVPVHAMQMNFIDWTIKPLSVRFSFEPDLTSYWLLHLLMS